jgi:hypothetical protein
MSEEGGRQVVREAYLRVQQQCRKVQSQTHPRSLEAPGMKMGERHHLELQESERKREREREERESDT